MKLSEVCAPQVHDLLQIDAHSLTADSVSQPPWVREALSSCPWVVVRRSQSPPAGQVSVGVRGASRSERWAGFCGESVIKKTVRPEELLAIARSSTQIHRTPALNALWEVIERWRDLSLPWGPTGSVGFELATRLQVTTDASDLDLAIGATNRIDPQRASFLWDRLPGLQAKVDVRVETPACSFSLEEYAHASSARILLRYPDSLRLGDDPWSLMTTGQSNVDSLDSETAL
jgi:phosphoribosyl-dephospho-CoA transferase